MLYTTLNQFFVFSLTLLIGMISGLFYDLSNLIATFCNKNKIVKQFFYFFSTFLSFFILFLTNLTINFGQFRFFVLASFLLGLYIERKFISSPITNLINKILSKLKAYRDKRKLLKLEKIKKHD